MIAKRKKSLPFILLGITLFIFTLTLTKPDLGRTRNYEKTRERSSTSKVVTVIRLSNNQRGKRKNLMKKLHNPLQKSSQSTKNEPESSNSQRNEDVLSSQGNWYYKLIFLPH